MRTITCKTSHDSSFSSSKRYFQWRRKKEEDEEGLVFNSFSSTCEEEDERAGNVMMAPTKKKTAIVRSIMTILTGKKRWQGHGHRIMGTLFGHRRSNVHFAFQLDPRAPPLLLIELDAPMDGLVMEMASGVVRIALECDKIRVVDKRGVRLLEEPLWRAYCNGRKCGSAVRRECSPAEWKVLKAVEPISMGAGVLPGNGAGSENETMYMRARFERVVGSKDSEAFYMINPDGSGGPELSIFFIRV